MLINKTYFNGDISIPNMQEVDYDNGNIDDFIDNESRLLLESIFGFDLFSELVTYLDADGNLEPSAPDKWQNLVYGVHYEVGNTKRKFSGLLLNPESTIPKSLIADYVFYRWLKQNTSQSTGVGEVALEAKNAINVNPTQKLVTVWNRFYRQIGTEYFGIDHHNHPHFCGIVNGTYFIDWYGYRNYYVSLFDYLKDHKEDFPTVMFALPDDEFHGFKNQLGL